MPPVAGAEVLYELEWGQVVERTGERPRVQVLTCDVLDSPADCAALVTYFNVLTSQADLDIEIETTIGPIGIEVAPRRGHVTDVLAVEPPPGYIAEPPSLDVGEGETGVIVVRPMLLGSR